MRECSPAITLPCRISPHLAVQVQLAMLEEEVTAAKLKLGSKDQELDLILEESTAREEQAGKCSLRTCHSRMYR